MLDEEEFAGAVTVSPVIGEVIEIDFEDDGWEAIVVSGEITEIDFEDDGWATVVVSAEICNHWQVEKEIKTVK